MYLVGCINTYYYILQLTVFPPRPPPTSKMGDEERAAAEVGEALKEVSLNGDAAGDPAAPAEEAPPLSPRGDPSACAHCSRVGATRRCAKRHQKCLQRLFCDKVCEEAAHKKKPQQAVKVSICLVVRTEAQPLAKESVV